MNRPPFTHLTVEHGNNGSSEEKVKHESSIPHIGSTTLQTQEKNSTPCHKQRNENVGYRVQAPRWWIQCVSRRMSRNLSQDGYGKWCSFHIYVYDRYTIVSFISLHVLCLRLQRLDCLETALPSNAGEENTVISMCFTLTMIMQTVLYCWAFDSHFCCDWLCHYQEKKVGYRVQAMRPGLQCANTIITLPFNAGKENSAIAMCCTPTMNTHTAPAHRAHRCWNKFGARQWDKGNGSISSASTANMITVREHNNQTLSRNLSQDGYG